MGSFRIAGVVCAFVTLTACMPGLSSQAYPGRTEVTFMGADKVTQRTYLCQPSDTLRQTQARAAQAHRYVDGAIRSAQRRYGVSGQGIVNNLAGQAEVNAEIAEVSRQAEAEYRCILLKSKDTSRGLFAT